MRKIGRIQVDNSEVAENPSIKRSFLALGIDLDETLIERMQRNLGTSASFDAIARASNVVVARDERQKQGCNPDIIYRNAIESQDQELKRPRIFQADKYRTASILRDLHDRESALEPHKRAALDKMVRTLRVSHARNPDRFVAVMFGCPKNVKRNDSMNLLLKTRYVDETFFKDVMKRLLPQESGSNVGDMFTLLEEKKKFANNPKKVVDLWLFLSLLTAEDQSRRTYDLKTSQSSQDVEFWNLKRAPLPNGPTNSPVRSLSATATGRLSSKGALHAIHAMDVGNLYEPVTITSYDDAQLSSVADALGQRCREHRSKAAGGRSVVGFFSTELKQSYTDDVATALNSPSASRGSNRSQSPRRQGQHANSGDDRKLTGHDLFDGLAVSALLGGSSESPRKSQANSYNALKKEWAYTKSVADALGRSDGAPDSTAAVGSTQGRGSPQKRASSARRGVSSRQTSAGVLAAEDKFVDMKDILKHASPTIRAAQKG